MSQQNPKKKFNRLERQEAIKFHSYCFHSADEKVDFLLAVRSRMEGVNAGAKDKRKADRLLAKAVQERTEALSDFADLVSEHF